MKGYKIKHHNTWNEIVFTDEEKTNIRNEYATRIANGESSHQILSTQIRDRLFPFMPPEVKDNAAYQIQVILGRDYSGN